MNEKILQFIVVFSYHEPDHEIYCMEGMPHPQWYIAEIHFRFLITDIPRSHVTKHVATMELNNRWN
jgi:hypothetical protein